MLLEYIGLGFLRPGQDSARRKGLTQQALRLRLKKAIILHGGSIPRSPPFSSRWIVYPKRKPASLSLFGRAYWSLSTLDTDTAAGALQHIMGN